MDSAFVVDLSDPRVARRYNMAQTIGCLSITVNTGLKHSKGSVLEHARRTYGIKSRTYKGALKEMKALYKKETGRDYGS